MSRRTGSPSVLPGSPLELVIRGGRLLFAGFELLLRVLGPTLVVVAFSLIGRVIYVVTQIVLPVVTTTLSPAWLLHWLISIYLSFCILFNYYKVIRTPPGCVPASYALADELEQGHGDEVRHAIEATVANGSTSEGGEEALLAREKAKELRRRIRERQSGSAFPSDWCFKCDALKPPMTHHCSVCKKCVLRMDHHCPWIWNCVGFFNHKFFFLFLFYLWLGCFYAASMCMYAKTNYFKGPGDRDVRGAIAFSMMLALSVSLAVSILMFWHAYLIATAQTTIEYHWNRQRATGSRLRGEEFVNPYDLGWKQNIEVFFGVSDWYMFWVPSSSPPSGDGLEYLTREQLLRGTGVGARQQGHLKL